MKTIRASLCLLAISLLLNGCSGVLPEYKQTEPIAKNQVAAPPAQGAITVNIVAEPGLNAWNEIANSCTLLVIQAPNASTLSKLISSPAQLKSLFGGAGAQDEVLKVDRYAAMPGQQTTLHIDRSENTRQVAIVAGFYPFPTKQHTAIVPIPVITRSEGWWNKRWYAELAPLEINITLGSQSITRLTWTQSELNTTPEQPENSSAQRGN